MLMSTQTMAQARRTRLKRALTEVTSDTVSYVRTVGSEGVFTRKELSQVHVLIHLTSFTKLKYTMVRSI